MFHLCLEGRERAGKEKKGRGREIGRQKGRKHKKEEKTEISEDHQPLFNTGEHGEILRVGCKFPFCYLHLLSEMQMPVIKTCLWVGHLESLI